MKTKEILYTIWLVIITAMVVMIYSRQTIALSGLNDSLSNQDTLKKNQDTMMVIKNEHLNQSLKAINEFLNKNR